MTSWKSVCFLSFVLFLLDTTSILPFALSITTLLTMAILHIPCTCHGVGGVTDRAWIPFTLPFSHD